MKEKALCFLTQQDRDTGGMSGMTQGDYNVSLAILDQSFYCTFDRFFVIKNYLFFVIVSKTVFGIVEVSCDKFNLQ